MKYFRVPNMGIRALNLDGSQDFLIKDDWVLLSECPLCLEYYNSDSGVYDFQAIKSNHKFILSNKCRETITLTPVTSTALGFTHSYDCRESDQTNARSAYTLANANGETKGIMCNDSTRFEMRQHTAEQALGVLDAMFTHISTQRAHLALKAGEVDAVDIDSYETPQGAIDAINAIEF